MATDNEIGTAAAYLTGVFFAVVGFTGRVPRIKHGEWEMDPVSAAAVATEVTTDLAAEAVRETATKTDDPKEIAQAAESAGDAVLQTLRVALFEKYGADSADHGSGGSMGDAAYQALLRRVRAQQEIFPGNKSYRLGGSRRGTTTEGASDPDPDRDE